MDGKEGVCEIDGYDGPRRHFYDLPGSFLVQQDCTARSNEARLEGCWRWLQFKSSLSTTRRADLLSISGKSIGIFRSVNACSPQESQNSTVE